MRRFLQYTRRRNCRARCYNLHPLLRMGWDFDCIRPHPFRSSHPSNPVHRLGWFDKYKYSRWCRQYNSTDCPPSCRARNPRYRYRWRRPVRIQSHLGMGYRTFGSDCWQIERCSPDRSGSRNPRWWNSDRCLHIGPDRTWFLLNS